jgi:hypothetical protein
VRLAWASPLTTTTFTDPRNGRVYSGKYQLLVQLYEPNENLPVRKGGPLAVVDTVLAHRQRAGIGQPLQIDAPPDRLAVDTVAVPENVLADLPADGKLQFIWQFFPEAAK